MSRYPLLSDQGVVPSGGTLALGGVLALLRGSAHSLQLSQERKILTYNGHTGRDNVILRL